MAILGVLLSFYFNDLFLKKVLLFLIKNLIILLIIRVLRTQSEAVIAGQQNNPNIYL